jgi:hypothetical protein
MNDITRVIVRVVLFLVAMAVVAYVIFAIWFSSFEF